MADFYSDSNHHSGKYSKLKKEIFEWLDIAAISMIAVVLLFTLLFKVVNVTGSSMEYTYLNNDKVVISKLFYEPKEKDVVVISRNAYNSPVDDSEEPIIKRVIATEGQTVDIDFNKGIVYVDGNAISESYIKEKTHRQGDVTFPLTVKKGCVFVMGDNRNKSLDSRYSEIGQVDKRYILGKAICRIFPFSRFKVLV